MGVWEGLQPRSDLLCDVPGCEGWAVTCFGPVFESSGGWTGDHWEYDPRLNIGFVCHEHKPAHLKEA